MAVAGMGPDGRHRSIDHPKVLRTPPDSPHRVRASYHTPRPLMLAPNQLPAQQAQQQQLQNPGGHPIYQANNPHNPGYNPQQPQVAGEFYQQQDQVGPGGLAAPRGTVHPTTRTLTRQSRLRSSAENLVGKVLEEHGLDRYVDPKCIKQELAEATHMTVEELDAAAHELMQQQSDADNPHSQYYEHLGGYGMHEMKDYNKYSTNPHPQNTPKPMGSRHGFNHPAHHPSDYPDADNDDMVYVTTL